jgi:hypothetical protein
MIHVQTLPHPIKRLVNCQSSFRNFSNNSSNLSRKPISTENFNIPKASHNAIRHAIEERLPESRGI